MLLDNEPGLADVGATLKRDHSMLSHLIGAMQLQQALDRHDSAEQLHRHVDGVEAVMQHTSAKRNDSCVACLSDWIPET